MAILKKITVKDDWSTSGANIPDLCFTCGEPLSLPLVYWAGCNGRKGCDNDLQIWLHPGCALKLGQNLADDARKAISA